MKLNTIYKKINLSDINFDKTKDILFNLFDLYFNAKKYVDQFDFIPMAQKIEVVSQIPEIINDSSYLFPEFIKNYIKNSSSLLVKFNFYILDERNINIYFICCDETITSINNLTEYAKKISLWITMIHNIASLNCSKNLDLYIFFTPFNKKLPNSQLDFISSKDINTAYTTSCSLNTEIVIFRQEEWFKVFLHETFHNFGLDFSHYYTNNMNKELEKLFNLNIDFKLYEAYTETWARIMNIFFISINNIKTKSKFFDKFIVNIKKEIIHSCIQANKLLDFYDLNYLYLLKNKSIYKENTAAFSYYILTSCLLYNYDKFFLWCYDNNTNLFKFNNIGIFDFIDFIKQNCKNKVYIKSMKTIDDYSKKEVFHNSMRMSHVDLF
jgi:hypothetical protein